MDRFQLSKFVVDLAPALAVALAAVSMPAAAEPLQLEAKIPLGKVVGRIDHMAFDTARRRLFVAELGNDSVGVVDVEAHQVVHRITGLRHPQGSATCPRSISWSSPMRPTALSTCSAASNMPRPAGSISAPTPTMSASMRRRAACWSAMAAGRSRRSIRRAAVRRSMSHCRRIRSRSRSTRAAIAFTSIFRTQRRSP